MTCLTTAIGFGVFAAIGIMILYLLSITMIPLSYVRLRKPRENVMSLATHDRFARFFDSKAQFIERWNGAFVAAAGALVVVGIIGAMQISTDIFVFSDFYEDDPLRQNLAVFEEHFGGVLPMEVVIESEREGRFKTLGSMRRLEQLQRQFSAFEPVGTTLC